MSLPETLPARAYLLSYDRTRQRLVRGTGFGLALTAAALADLLFSGHLVDDAGTARAAAHRGEPDDPVLAQVWRLVADGRPRTWQALLPRGSLETPLRDRLASARLIRIDREPRFLRPARISVRDPRVLTRLGQRVAATLRGPLPVSRLDIRDTTLVALLVAGEIRTAVDKDRQREYARRIEEMAARGEPIVGALRAALRRAKSQAAG